MYYAIVINLDYENYPYDECSRLLGEIRERMVAAGFYLDGRLFKITGDAEEACGRAREVIQSIEDDLPEYKDLLINDYIKEFYGYDHSSSTNLLLPPVDSIQIDKDWKLPKLK